MKELRDESTAIKHFFGKELLARVGKALGDVYPAFDARSFTLLAGRLEGLEMKLRVQRIRDELKRQLPEDYRISLELLLASTRAGTIRGFDLWPYTDYIQTFGLGDVELSLDALKRLTSLFTAEFAVRPFIRLHRERALAYLEACSLDRDVHVRRWASEGSRPRLPWGERLQELVKDPSPTLAILENLKFDDELYVRKSVSNHLNDIAKDHPDYVIKRLALWKKEAGKSHFEKVEWIIQRSLRTLIKAGHPEALRLIGVQPNAAIKVSPIGIGRKAYKLGDRLDFRFRIESLADSEQKLVVDYIVHYAKANRKTSPKVFKLRTLQLPARGRIDVRKSHHLKEVSTRVHYAGAHVLEIQVNGVVLKRVAWDLSI